MPVYYEIPAADVPYAKRQVVERAVQTACHHLGIRLWPVIRWFTEEDDAQRAFVATSGEVSHRLTADGGILEGRTVYGEDAVWIRASAALEELPVTAAHEVAHLALGRVWGLAVTALERAYLEGLAEAYGRRYRMETRP